MGRESLTPLGSQEVKLGKLVKSEMLGQFYRGMLLALAMFQPI